VACKGKVCELGDAAQFDAAPLEDAFLQNVARRRIGDPGASGARRSDTGFYEDADTCIGIPHYLTTQYLRPKSIKPSVPEWGRELRLVRV
jgi:hypothetical protein